MSEVNYMLHVFLKAIGKSETGLILFYQQQYDILQKL